MKKSLLAVALSALLLTGCNSESVSITPEVTPVTQQVKFAQFNLSFALDGDSTENYERWVTYMSYTPEQQQEIIDNQVTEGSDPFIPLYQRIAQIRNVAAIIQKNRPDVLLMNEFNNNGEADDDRMLLGFMKNYLSVGQSINSVEGGDLLEPIHYPYFKQYATNTGLPIDMDVNNDGVLGSADDTQGFGFYHGHYGFTLLSMHEIDNTNTRTFQKLLRKDMPDSVNPTIEICDGSKPIPEDMSCGDNWYSNDVWNVIRMSSKNHVDAPIIVETKNGDVTINAFLAHPTPSGFDTVSYNNRYRNSDENRFWANYLDGYEFKDDKGIKGGFSGEHFVVMGDLNADDMMGTQVNKPYDGILQIMNHPLVNQEVSRAGGSMSPKSSGGTSEPNEGNNWNPPHDYPEVRTSTFGSRADYAVPSKSLKTVDTGVCWAAEGEEGRLLFNDYRYEKGENKAISSDHRMVWVTVEVTK